MKMSDSSKTSLPAYYGRLDPITLNMVQCLAKIVAEQSAAQVRKEIDADAKAEKTAKDKSSAKAAAKAAAKTTAVNADAAATAKIQNDDTSKNKTSSRIAEITERTIDAVKPLSAKNLCCCTVRFDFYSSDGACTTYCEDVKVPFRGFAEFCGHIPDTVFVSSEREKIRTMFKDAGVKIREQLPEIGEYSKNRGWMLNEMETFLTKEYCSKFCISCPRDFVVGNEKLSIIYRYDDTEVQVLRELEHNYREFAEKIIAKAMKESNDTVAMEVRCVIHTKFDPCPSCLYEVERFFQKFFLSETCKASKSLPTGCALFIIPVLASRFYYAHKPHCSTRELLNWEAAYELAEFKVPLTTNDDDDDDDGDDDDLAAQVPLVLYAISPLDLK